MASVAHVLSSGFGRSWHEAVAIVQEAAQQLHAGMALPGPEDIEIDEAGTLLFGFGDETSDNPVTSLAGLLGSLLQGVEAPQSLVDLVAENAKANPAHASVATFSQALAFFERPNRSNDIRAVAGRLRTFREKSSVDQEFERLREKVAHADEDKPEQTQRRKKTKLSKRQKMMAAAAIWLVILGAFAFQFGLHRNLGLLTERAESGIQGAVTAGLDKIGITIASAAPGPEPVEAERPSSSPKRAGIAPGRSKAVANSTRPPAPARVARPTSSIPPTALVPETNGATSPVATTGVPPIAPLPASRGESATTLAALPGGGAVFSVDNPEVRAPVLVRPQLPKEPAPGDDTGIFDMLIDENGDVAHIKLISPRRRYHDRMLVAAAKAWKFKPATLNGHAVKYRIRIPIILTGMP